MYRDRIRVRPASGRPSLDPYGSLDSDDYAVHRSSAAPTTFAASVNDSQRAEATSSFQPYVEGEEGSEGLRYARRIAQLAYDTVSSVFGAFRGKSGDGESMNENGDFSAAPLPPPQAAALASPAVPPNTPYTAATSAAAPTGADISRAETAGGRFADTIERRQPRPYDYHRDASNPPPPPPSQYQQQQQQRWQEDGYRAADVAAVPRVVSLREAPQYQITVNQYFAAPERSAYPIVATAPTYVAPRPRATLDYQPRVSLLTVPSAVRPQPKRERSNTAEKETSAVQQPAAKVAKTAEPFMAASDISLSNAPSAIPHGSPDNSLTVPISVTGGSAALFGKAKAADAPLFGPKPTAPAAPAFTFGAKPTTTTAASTTTAPAAAPATGGFVKAGPPAVIADDDGFASNADSGDEKGEEKKAAAPAAPAKPAFSFSASTLKPAFTGATTTPTAAATAPAASSQAPPANPFSFSPKPAEKPATAAAPPAASAPKMNGFFKTGPAAVIPDDSGFAPNADSDGEDGDKAPAKAESAPAAASKPPAFSFNIGNAAPAFGSNNGTTPTSAAAPPASPPKAFSFAPKPADAAPASTTPFPNSFVKAGPAAVIPDDSSFAPNADSDDDNDNATGGAKRSRSDGAAPAPAPASSPFSFTASASAAKPTFGSGGATFGSPSGPSAPTFSFGAPATTSESPANPFKFGASPAAGGASSPFGSGASSPFGSGAAPTFTFGKK